MSIADQALVGLGYALPSGRRPLVRLTENERTTQDSEIAEEIPVALVYNGRPHVVVLGTPTDLEDLAVGFSVTEGVVDAANEIERVEVVRASHGVELQLQIPGARADRMAERHRGLAARTGCGLCGIASIDEVLRMPHNVGSSLTVRADALWRAGESLAERQQLNRATSSVHAAAWADVDGTLQVVREDVGRHNALDKVLGAMLRGTRSPASGFVLVTSRASYELVQKAAVCGVEALAAISRPTGLAIRFADAAGLTLVALLRGRSANIYSRPERIKGKTDNR